MIPVLVPDLPNGDDLAPFLCRIDAARRYSNFGPLVAEFEATMALQLGEPGAPVGCVATSSGHMGLEAALSCLGLRPGTGVLVPALTFPGTASAVLRAGFRPILADIDATSWQLSPYAARAALRITDFGAVVPVATFGVPVPTAEWDAFVAETRLPVVVDAAPAFGYQSIGGRTTTVFSLHATKPLGIGEGGMVASRDENFLRRVRQWINFGIADGQAQGPGSNGKLNEFAAAVGLAQFGRWTLLKAKRRALWADYRQTLGEAPGVTMQADRPDWAPSVLVLDLPGSADEWSRYLASQGIETRAWYCPALHRHPAFAGLARVGGLPVASTLDRRLLGIPFHTHLTPPEVEQICAAVLAGVATPCLTRKSA